MHSRKDTLVKALKLIRMFEDGKHVTVKDIKVELELSTTNAYRWLRDASLVLEIYEDGSIVTGKRGCPTKVFRML